MKVPVNIIHTYINTNKGKKYEKKNSIKKINLKKIILKGFRNAVNKQQIAISMHLSTYKHRFVITFVKR